MAGDTVRAEVYAKYLDPDQQNWTAGVASLAAAMTSGANGTIIDGAAQSAPSAMPFQGLLAAPAPQDEAPAAYLNVLLFDKHMNPILEQSRAIPVTEAAKENGSNVPHERLATEVVAKEAGYAYIWLSNENNTPVDVFFDDFTVFSTVSPVVQVDDYYPFGWYWYSQSLPRGMSLPSACCTSCSWSFS